MEDMRLDDCSQQKGWEWLATSQLDHAVGAATCDACFVSLQFCPTVPTDSRVALLEFGVRICFWLFLPFIKSSFRVTGKTAGLHHFWVVLLRTGEQAPPQLAETPSVIPSSEAQRSERRKWPTLVRKNVWHAMGNQTGWRNKGCRCH